MAIWPFRRRSRKRSRGGATMSDLERAPPRAHTGDPISVQRRSSQQKKAARTTNEGAVGTYIHAGGKIGVLLEVNCESYFVALTADFQELLKDIAMHIAATDPRYVKP